MTGKHGRGLGLVAFERLHGQRESRRVSQQPQGDLRFKPAFLGEAGFAEAVPGVGLEVQLRDVEEHQAGWPQPVATGTGAGQRLVPPRLGIAGQAPLEGGIRGWFDPDFAQHPFGVDLAGGFDDPRQHQITKHVVALGGDSNPRIR